MPNRVNFGQVGDALAAGRQAAQLTNINPASINGSGQGTVTGLRSAGLLSATNAYNDNNPNTQFMWGQTTWGDKTHKVSP